MSKGVFLSVIFKQTLKKPNQVYSHIYSKQNIEQNRIPYIPKKMEQISKLLLQLVGTFQ